MPVVDMQCFDPLITVETKMKSGYENELKLLNWAHTSFFVKHGVPFLTFLRSIFFTINNPTPTSNYIFSILQLLKKIVNYSFIFFKRKKYLILSHHRYWKGFNEWPVNDANMQRKYCEKTRVLIYRIESWNADRVGTEHTHTKENWISF